MNLRQRLLKAIYPLIRTAAQKGDKGKIVTNTRNIKPGVSFYSLAAKTNKDALIDFSTLEGKMVLVVNTASDCGYTGQYAELQKLFMLYEDRLVILGFPANDFKNQENYTDADIASFCSINYGVTFPIMKRSTVVRAAEQHEVYNWLTNSSLNGWNNHEPDWNFSKYLISPTGTLLAYLGPAVSPDSIARWM